MVLYPDPRLRAKNKLIKVFDEKLQQLVDEMFDIMYKYASEPFILHWLESKKDSWIESDHISKI